MKSLNFKPVFENAKETLLKLELLSKLVEERIKVVAHYARVSRDKESSVDFRTLFRYYGIDQYRENDRELLRFHFIYVLWLFSRYYWGESYTKMIFDDYLMIINEVKSNRQLRKIYEHFLRERARVPLSFVFNKSKEKLKFLKEVYSLNLSYKNFLEKISNQKGEIPGEGKHKVHIGRDNFS